MGAAACLWAASIVIIAMDACRRSSPPQAPVDESVAELVVEPAALAAVSSAGSVLPSPRRRCGPRARTRAAMRAECNVCLEPGARRRCCPPGTSVPCSARLCDACTKAVLAKGFESCVQCGCALC